MSFKDKLNAEIIKLEANTGGDFPEVTHPSSTLKHDMLYLSAEAPEHLVRILPPKDENSFFAVGFKRIFFDVTNASGKRINSPMLMPLQSDPENNLLDAKVGEWVQNKTMPGQYPGTRPQTRYYLNVVRLQNNNGEYLHELNEDGSPLVRVMEVPLTAYRGIINDLSDTNIADPVGAVDFGAISAENAYPFIIKRTGVKIDTKYHVRMYENDLGPLPQGWQEQAEDLNYLATPSEEYNKEFVHYMIAVHEGREAEFNAERGGGDAQATTPATPPPVQPGFGPVGGTTTNITDEDMGHLPPKEGATPPPAQPGFGQPGQQPATPPPAQPGFGQPGQQPATPPPTQPGFGQPGGQPATTPPPANPIPTTPPPVAQPNTGDLPDVEELLNKVKNEAGN